jgi:hypothetical protein
VAALTPTQLEALAEISEAVLAGLEPVGVACEPEGGAQWGNDSIPLCGDQSVDTG